MTLPRTLFVSVLLAFCALPASAQEKLAIGDRAWDARAEVLDGRLATQDKIEEAVRSYRVACDTAPNPAEACWKLLRALHYLIEFTNASERRKDEAVEEVVSLARTSIDALGEGDGNVRDSAQLYFWAAIVWGARGRRGGVPAILMAVGATGPPLHPGYPSPRARSDRPRDRAN